MSFPSGTTEEYNQMDPVMKLKHGVNNIVKDEQQNNFHILQRLREYKVPVHDFIKESCLYKDIEIRTNTDDRNSIKVNRVVLAASSPFLKKCLKNPDYLVISGNKLVCTYNLTK